MAFFLSCFLLAGLCCGALFILHKDPSKRSSVYAMLLFACLVALMWVPPQVEASLFAPFRATIISLIGGITALALAGVRQGSALWKIISCSPWRTFSLCVGPLLIGGLFDLGGYAESEWVGDLTAMFGHTLLGSWALAILWVMSE